MKVLIVRFSSIGDIVLTTPVIRGLKQQLKAEVHVLTKKAFAPVLQANPYIDRLWLMHENMEELVGALRAEEFDHLVDLHNNLRTAKLKSVLNVPSTSFKKYNIEKWLLVNFKINKMPDVHIVDRYKKAAAHLGLLDDGHGLDYFLSENDEPDRMLIPKSHQSNYVAFVIGGQHPGKMLPPHKIEEICSGSELPVMLLGGPEDAAKGETIAKKVGPSVFNAAGKFKLNESAALVRDSDVVVTHDTGLMHVAAAFKKRIISIWGATVPEFGMYPYRPGEGSVHIEPKGVWDRPYSKLGDNKWYKPNFKGMDKIDVDEVVRALNQ